MLAPAPVHHQGMPLRVLRVRCGAVIALLVILDRELPVGRNVVVLVCGKLQVLEIKHCHRLGQVASGTFETRWIVRKTDENQPVNDIQRY